MRILNSFRSNREKRFLKEWEILVFACLENDPSVRELLNKIPKRKYKYFLEYVREYLITLSGEDFLKLSRLITSTNFSSYLLKRLNSSNTNKVIFSSFFIGISNIEEAKPLLLHKIKTHNEQIFFSCASALAKMNSYESLGIILEEFNQYKQFGYEYLLLILTEYDEKICEEIIPLIKPNQPEQLIITFIRLLRFYKYYNGGQSVLTTLIYSYSKEIIIECLRFIEETKYINAISAVSRLIEHSKPEIKSQAIKTLVRLDNKNFEDKIYSKLFENNYDVQYQAAYALLNFCEDGEDRLSELAYDVQKSSTSAISRMLLSEKKIKDGK